MNETGFHIALIVVVVSWAPVCWLLLYLERKFPRLFRWHVPILLFVPVCIALILNIPHGYVEVHPTLGSRSELRETFLFSEVFIHTLNSVNTIIIPALVAVFVPALLLRFVVKMRKFGLKSSVKFLLYPLSILIFVITFWVVVNLYAQRVCFNGPCDQEIPTNIPTVSPISRPADDPTP